MGGGDYARWLVGTGNKNVWAYDTFSGIFPVHTATDGESNEILHRIACACSTTTRASLEAIGVTCVTGEFPASFHEAHPKSVSFVHVDMDTYVTTLSALSLFHPLMIEGGAFLVHDYENSGLKGVHRAVHEFMAGPHGEQYECGNEGDHYKMRKRISQKP